VKFVMQYFKDTSIVLIAYVGTVHDNESRQSVIMN
jgi:hypothetical protein